MKAFILSILVLLSSYGTAFQVKADDKLITDEEIEKYIPGTDPEFEARLEAQMITAEIEASDVPDAKTEKYIPGTDPEFDARLEAEIITAEIEASDVPEAVTEEYITGTDPEFDALLDASIKASNEKEKLADGEKDLTEEELKVEAQKRLTVLYKKCQELQNKEDCAYYDRVSNRFFERFAEIAVDEAYFVKKTKYNPDSCIWSFDLPRRIISRPGCGKGKKADTCIGYVICELEGSGLKHVRMSTCSENNCGDDDAVACTKEGGFSSRGNTIIDTATEKVKSVLGASKQ